MFLALQMWRFDVFHLPLFFLMTGWTEWHFILFLTSTKTLCKKETMAGCKPQSIFRADTAQTLFEMYNYYEINILFLSDISADFFPPLNLWCFFIFLSQSQRRHLGLYREAVLEDLVTKCDLNSWSGTPSKCVNIQAAATKQGRKHSQCIIDDIITPRANRTHRQTHSIAGKMALWASCRVLSGCDFKVQVETGDQKETHTCFYLQVLQ